MQCPPSLSSSAVSSSVFSASEWPREGSKWVIEHRNLEEIHRPHPVYALASHSTAIAVDQSRTSSSTSLHILSSWLVGIALLLATCHAWTWLEERLEWSAVVELMDLGWTGLQDSSYGLEDRQ